MFQRFGRDADTPYTTEFYNVDTTELLHWSYCKLRNLLTHPQPKLQEPPKIDTTINVENVKQGLF